MKFNKYIKEAAYQSNMGFIELCQFGDVATEKDIKEMEKIIKANDWEAYKKIIKRVLGVSLF